MRAVRRWRPYPVDPSCVLYLPFFKYGGEQTKIWDISGQNNHGVITGATPTILGWLFNGTSDKLTIPSINLLTVHTLHFWLTSQNSAGVVLGGAANYHGLRIETELVGYNVGTIEVTVTHDGIAFLENTLFSVVRNGTSVTFYQEGRQLGLPQTLLANNDLTVDTVGNNSSGANWFGGILSELIAVKSLGIDIDIRNYWELNRSKYGSAENILFYLLLEDGALLLLEDGVFLIMEE